MAFDFFAYTMVLAKVIAMVIIMGVAYFISIGIVEKMSGEIKVWQELRRKNMAVAIVLAAIILGLSLVVALSN